MISDGLLLSLIACACLSLLGFKKGSTAALFVSSVGLLICALMVFQETESVAAMALILMISFTQFILGGTRES